MILLIIFFGIKGILHFDFILQGQTVSQSYYLEIFKWLLEAVHRKSLNFGPTIRFSTMTMLQFTRRFLPSSFWPKNPLLKWNTHPILLIWLRITSGSFRK
jgi:hypothetical protein